MKKPKLLPSFVILFLAVFEIPLGKCEPVTPEIVNTWAEKILDHVYNSRHADIYKSFDDPKIRLDIEATRDNLINNYRGQPEADVFQKLSVDDYIAKFRTDFDEIKSINTIAVMVNGDKVYVAGNIKNAALPDRLSDPNLFEKVAFGKEIIYPHDKFDIQDFDAPEIKKAFAETNIGEVFDGKQPQLLIVKAEGQGEFDLKMDELKNAEWNKIAEAEVEKHQKRLEKLAGDLEKNPKFKNNPGAIQEKLALQEGKLQLTLAQRKETFLRDAGASLDYKAKVKKAHVYHAEMQLLQKLKQEGLPDGNKAVFGVSKSLCEKCQQGISDAKVQGKPGNEVVDFKQHDKPGLAADKVKNWDHPPGISVTDLNEVDSRYAKAKVEDPDNIKLNSVDLSGCNRRKRSASLACGKLDSKQFVKEYANGNQDLKDKLTSTSKRNDLELVGSADDVQKVNNLEKLETIKGVQKASTTSKLKGKAGNVWNDIKLTTKKVQTKLSQTKLAKKISSFTSGKGFRRASSSISKASAPIGVFLLGKGIINGVIHKDYTSLGIIGGRLGIEAVEWGAKGAGKLLKVGSKMGKTAKLIGKAAGPIGIVADVGLSVWSLTKAVGRLQDAKDQYESNDAIADIVQESIDIAITTAVVVATIAFPPAGIAIAVVGLVANLVTQLFVGVYKTQNEINKINSEVPLLDWERNAQFSERFMNWFGTRKDDYIDDLVKVKKLNDVFVQLNLKFLENSPHLSGIAFPARSIAYSGACKYTRNHCPLKNIWGCTKNFESEVVLQRGCDHGQKCGSHKCTNWWESTGIWAYDEYRCVCSGSSNVKEGYPRANNYVDFRSQRSIYLERAVPKDVTDANFRCKPGHEEYQDYQISQEKPSTGYLCKGTIALYQKNFGGSTFYFDLEDGDDTVLLDSNSKVGNTFIINNGHKFFSAGAGKDEFIIHPNCTSLAGSIDGGGGSNSLVISNEFLKGTTVIYRGLDFKAGSVTLKAKGISDIVGRAKETEDINVPCGLKNLRLQGGSKFSPDVIEVNGICDKGKAKLAAVFEGNTRVRWQDREFQLVSLPGEIGEKLELEMKLSDYAFGTILVNHSSGAVSNFNYNKKSDSQLELNWNTRNSGYKYQIKLNSNSPKEMEKVKFLFAETGSTYSNLVFGKEGPSLIHSLSKIEGVGISERAAIDGIDNAFIFSSGAWNVNCGQGEYQVQLILSSDFTQGSISCQLSKRNVLIFHENNVQAMELDLLNGRVGAGIKVSGIRMIQGRKSIQEIVTVGCDTELVTTNGGTDQNPDIIRIPERKCTASELFIVALGSTSIEDNNFSKGQGSVQVSVMDDSNELLNFSASSTSESSVAYEIMLQEFILYPKNPKHSTTQTMISLQGSRGQKLYFQISHNFKSHQLLPGPTITFRGKDDGAYAGNLMSDTKGNVRNVHFLSGHSQGCKPHFGVVGLPNYFKISGNCWAIKGAEGGFNYFLLEAEQLPGTTISGGRNSADNTLDAEGYGKSGEKINFDFILNWMGASFSEGTRVRNINQFYGRRNQSDEIVLSCGSGLLSLDGRGGLNSNNPDKFIIKDPKEAKNCKDVAITLSQFTKVENAATKGSYIYDIMLESGIDAVQIVSTNENNHILQYRFHPSQLVSNISYNASKNGETAELKLTFVFNETLTYPAIFKTNGKLNPQLLFISNDELVSSEIQLDSESKQLLARWDIRSPAWAQIIGLEGVAFNKFIVNLTSNEMQQIIGGSEDNEYWLYSTPNGGLLIKGSEFGINSLHLSESYAKGKTLLVNLAEPGGSISLNRNVNNFLVSLENINEFYGRPQDIEIISPGCGTSLIYDADHIIIDPEACLFFYVDIYLSGKMEVLIVQNGQNNDTSISEPEGEFRFNFLSPISFTPQMNEKYENQFLLSDFIYNLHIKLENLAQLGFWRWNNTIFYNLESNPEESLPIQHQMLTDLDEKDEFYRQPKLVTKEGCELRVDRVGAITAICSGSSEQKSEMAKVAVRLGISIIWKFESEIAFFGHNSTEQRNILTTSANFTNHLFGGGAKDTIYEILFLRQNVYIYSGLSKDKKSDESITKQTIDLTDIIVPIRWKNGKDSKYVPMVKANESDLVISLPEYDAIHPGSIVIVNGVEQAANFQLLLNSAVMEFKPIGQISKSHRIKRDLGADEDENFNEWTITPKPVLIEPGVVFSISQEDLEDGHYITMADNENNSTFILSRDGDDLIMSDVKSFSSSAEPTLIILSDFYELKNYTSNNSTENLEQIVTVELPGLNFTLNNSEIVYSEDQIKTESWDEVLEEVEEELLENMAEVPRMFKIHRNTKLIVMASVATVLVLLFAVGFGYFRWKYYWSYRLKLNSNRKLGLSVFEINGIMDSREEEKELPLISILEKSNL